jgi:hypothetical protein
LSHDAFLLAKGMMLAAAHVVQSLHFMPSACVPHPILPASQGLHGLHGPTLPSSSENVPSGHSSQNESRSAILQEVNAVLEVDFPLGHVAHLRHMDAPGNFVYFPAAQATHEVWSSNFPAAHSSQPSAALD